MTLNIDVIWDNQNELNLVCFISKYSYWGTWSHMLRTVCPQSYLLRGAMMPWRERGERYDAIRTCLPLFFTFFTAIILLLFLLLFAALFPLFILTSFSFLFHLFLYHLYLHTSNLALKPSLFPTCHWTDQLPFLRHSLRGVFTFLNNNFPGAVSAGHCLICRFRLYICFQFLEDWLLDSWGTIHVQTMNCLSESRKKFYILGEDSQNK